MDIHPIRNEADHTAALEEIDTLWGSPSGTPEGDKLDVLITLVDRYEDEHFPIAAANPIDVIKAHMDLTGRSQRELAELLGSASRASEVLNTKRALTIEMVHKLNTLWGIPAQYLIVPYAIEKMRVRGHHPHRSRAKAAIPARKRA